MVRIALILASIASIAAGLGLVGLWFRFRNEPGMPIVVLLVAVSLMAATLMTTQATIVIFAAGTPEFAASNQTRTGER